MNKFNTGDKVTFKTVECKNAFVSRYAANQIMIAENPSLIFMVNTVRSDGTIHSFKGFRTHITILENKYFKKVNKKVKEKLKEKLNVESNLVVGAVFLDKRSHPTTIVEVVDGKVYYTQGKQSKVVQAGVASFLSYRDDAVSCTLPSKAKEVKSSSQGFLILSSKPLNVDQTEFSGSLSLVLEPIRLGSIPKKIKVANMSNVELSWVTRTDKAWVEDSEPCNFNHVYHVSPEGLVCEYLNWKREVIKPSRPELQKGYWYCATSNSSGYEIKIGDLVKVLVKSLNDQVLVRVAGSNKRLQLPNDVALKEINQ